MKWHEIIIILTSVFLWIALTHSLRCIYLILYEYCFPRWQKASPFACTVNLRPFKRKMHG